MRGAARRGALVSARPAACMSGAARGRTAAPGPSVGFHADAGVPTAVFLGRVPQDPLMLWAEGSGECAPAPREPPLLARLLGSFGVAFSPLKIQQSVFLELFL